MSDLDAGRFGWCGGLCAALLALGACSDAQEDTESTGEVRPGSAGSVAAGAGGSSAGTAGSSGSGGALPLPPACGGCEIAEVCYVDGDRNPANPCEQCDRDRDGQRWSPELEGTPCDDRRLCTVGDGCRAGRCEGTLRDCSDDRACTADERCDERLGCVAGTSTCAAPLTCLASGECGACESGFCAIAGACYSAGQPNPTNPCELCDPARTPSGWSPLSDGTACSDALACTSGDRCTAGSCRGMAQSCDDRVFCNGVESCVEASGACAVLSGTSPCATGCIEEEQRCAATCMRPGVGCACDGSQPASCNGAAQKQRLSCDAGVWRRSGADCAANQNCFNESGACAPIAAECVGRNPGDRICREGDVYSCGPDRVTLDLLPVASCAIGCELSGGVARCIPQDGSVIIDDVWPPTNARGGALLIVGRNFANVTAVWFGGQTYPLVSRDTSVPGYHKLVVQIPGDAPQIATDLRLLTSAGLSQQVQVFVDRNDLGGAVPGPSQPYGIQPLKPDPDPQPIPTYPPISNFWVNECQDTDIYFLQEDSPPQSESTVNRRPFSQVEQDPAPYDTITGYLESASLLLHMSVQAGGESKDYVGVFSETGAEGTFRLVLFPETSPGRQLLISVASDGSPIPGTLDLNECSP